jgi:PAS domain S-box-containing protein
MIETTEATVVLTFLTARAQALQEQLDAALAQSNTSFAQLAPEGRRELAGRVTAALVEGLAQQRPGLVLHALRGAEGALPPVELLAALDLLRHTVMGELKRYAAQDPAAAAELFEPVAEFLTQLATVSTSALLHEATAEASHTRTLNQLMRELHALPSLEALVPTAVRYVEPMGAHTCSVFLFEYEQGQPAWAKLIGGWRKDGQPMPVGKRYDLRDLPFAEVALSGQPVYLEDTYASPLVDPVTRRRIESLNQRALFSAPVVLEGQVVGGFWVAWPEPRQFSPQERDILDTIVFQAPFLAQRLLWIDQLQARVDEQSRMRGDLEHQAGQLKLFQMLIENARDGVAVMELDGRLVYANPAFLELTGARPEDMGTVQPSFYAPHEDERMVREVLPYIKQHGSWQGMVEMVRRGGARWTCSLSSYLIVDEQNLPRAACGFFRDITEQLRDEQERLRLQEQVIAVQQAALRELSTPIIPLTEDVMVMPLIGSIDSTRAQQIIESLLEGVSSLRVSTAILDITGVPIVDTQIANALLRSAQAVKLLGTRLIITGIRPEVAQTLVGLGVGLNDLTTYSTLQSGIASALKGLRR